MAAFEDAAAEGLSPEDYDSSRWPGRLHALASGDNNATAQFDVALTLCTMRFVSDLHMGRVAPQHFNFEIDTQSKKIDLPQFLNDKLLETSDVPGNLAALEPDSDDYRKAKEALATYRNLAKQQADPRLLARPRHRSQPRRRRSLQRPRPSRAASRSRRRRRLSDRAGR